MATNLALDDRLVEEAKRLGCHKSKPAAVNEALDEYVARRRQRGPDAPAVRRLAALGDFQAIARHSPLRLLPMVG